MAQTPRLVTRTEPPSPSTWCRNNFRPSYIDCITRSWTISFCCCCCCLRHPFNSSSTHLQVSKFMFILSSFQNREIVWQRENYPRTGSSLMPEKYLCWQKRINNSPRCLKTKYKNDKPAVKYHLLIPEHFNMFI